MAEDGNIISELSIVVVDDNRNFLKLVRSILRNFGIKDCTVFDDASTALSYLEIHAVDCVITDLVMPKMNGFELAQKIRHSTVIANRLLPIIMVTGHANRENVSKAVNSGIDEVLVKPFRPSDLQKRLLAIAQSPRRTIAAPGRTAKEVAQPAGARDGGPAKRAGQGMPVLKRTGAKNEPQTNGYFDKKIESDGPQKKPDVPQRKRLDVEQSDVFTVNRQTRKARPGNTAATAERESETWEI